MVFVLAWQLLVDAGFYLPAVHKAERNYQLKA
jgi:hypothetical protein